MVLLMTLIVFSFLYLVKSTLTIYPHSITAQNDDLSSATVSVAVMTALIPTTTPRATPCISSTLPCYDTCGIDCPSGQTLTGTRCPLCTCVPITPICSSTVRPTPTTSP
ncbi:hypothetical protein DFP72DRAFT_909750 [Ephemerocybe angulata]|uniref:Uncharacterized protein n=1 Tax=Ephemerocybe angulata TaxID=980116 RepID=A0A8H6HP72_9AGAR|nr:hypothetical protein DFP72DRAFT_909750 [Tulosesus angulatus]